MCGSESDKADSILSVGGFLDHSPTLAALFVSLLVNVPAYIIMFNNHSGAPSMVCCYIHGGLGVRSSWWGAASPLPAAADPRHMLSYVHPDNFEGFVLDDTSLSDIWKENEGSSCEANIKRKIKLLKSNVDEILR